MNKAISIRLFRVSGDSKHLDVMLDCPYNYYLNSFQLQVRYLENNKYKSSFFDLSPALFVIDDSENNTVWKKHWTVRIPLDKLGIEVPAIYIATIKGLPVFVDIIDAEDYKYSLPVPYNDTSKYKIDPETSIVYTIDDVLVRDPNGEIVYGKVFTDPCQHYLNTEPIEDTMVCSDVNNAYKCMLSDLLKEAERCSDGISDDAIRKYLLLYGHQAALNTQDVETAEVYFKLIGNCFEKCSGDHSCKRVTHSCNCGK